MTLIDRTRSGATARWLGRRSIRRATRSLGHATDLHPHWLRDRSTEPGQIEADQPATPVHPADIAPDLAVVAAASRRSATRWCRSATGTVRSSTSRSHVERALGLVHRRSRNRHPPEPWTSPLGHVSLRRLEWHRLDDAERRPRRRDRLPRGVLPARLRRVPQHAGRGRNGRSGSPNRLGYIVGQNFGWVFDVRAKPSPDRSGVHVDRAAGPHRRAVPAAGARHPAAALHPQRGARRRLDPRRRARRRHRPAARAPGLARRAGRDRGELPLRHGHRHGRQPRPHPRVRPHGRYRQIRFNTKLDEPVPASRASTSTAFYAGRRWLTEWLNDPAHQVTFRLEPGDIMFMDNHRALHGRTAFDPTKGHRHLQGCYIEHDGPDTMYRLAVRRACDARRMTEPRSNGGRTTAPTDGCRVVHARWQHGTADDYALLDRLRTRARRRTRRPAARHARPADRLARRLPDHPSRALAAVGDPGPARRRRRRLGRRRARCTTSATSSRRTTTANSPRPILQPYVREEVHWVVQHHGVFQSYYFAHHLGGDRHARDRFDGHRLGRCVRSSAPSGTRTRSTPTSRSTSSTSFADDRAPCSDAEP